MKLFVLICAVSFCTAFLPFEDPNLFEGDIILDPNQREAIGKGNSFSSTAGKLWPLTIPYEFHASLQNDKKIQEAVRLAIAHYKQHTCIRFVPKTGGHREYIKFIYQKSGCSSHIGTNGGERKVFIGPSCYSWPVIVHELMHALGFWHEQSRPDRDNFVKIIWGNIPSGGRINFKKYSKGEIDSLGTPYDFKSITHYTENAFTGNKDLLSIKALDPKNQQFIKASYKRDGLSEIDIKQIRLLYKCNGNKANTLHPPTKPPCMDYNRYCGGFVHRCSDEKGTGVRTWLEKDCRKTCGFCK